MPSLPSSQWQAMQLDVLRALRDEGHTWAEVAVEMRQTFHYPYTASACRQRYHEMKAANLAPDTILPAECLDPLEVAKAKLSGSMQRRADAQELEQRAYFEILADVLRESIEPLKFTQPRWTPPRTGPGDPEQAVLVLSDLHFGKRTPSYNTAIGLERLRLTCRRVQHITALHRNAYPVPDLHIIWNGDLVDGTSIYPTHPFHIDAPVVGQIFGNLPGIVEELAGLASYFQHVHNYCVRGNHGRVSKFAHEDDNFDRIFAEALRIATQGIPNMSWTIPDGWYCKQQIGGKRFLMTHGDQVKMMLNLPWYGITTRASRWASSVSLQDFDVLIMSHFHSSSHLRWNGKIIKVNGTQASGDEFAIEKIGLE
ncbi:MAG: metallophosphoesterase, partial [Kiritimatiellia bacterium]